MAEESQTIAARIQGAEDRMAAARTTLERAASGLGAAEAVAARAERAASHPVLLVAAVLTVALIVLAIRVLGKGD